MVIQERYVPLVLGVNASAIPINNQSVAGFICQTSGTLTLTAAAGDVLPSFNVLTAFPVTAGLYYPMPVFLCKNGGSVTLAGGASGTLLL